jgi:hypothetical protein
MYTYNASLTCDDPFNNGSIGVHAPHSVRWGPRYRITPQHIINKKLTNPVYICMYKYIYIYIYICIYKYGNQHIIHKKLTNPV